MGRRRGRLPRPARRLRRRLRQPQARGRPGADNDRRTHRGGARRAGRLGDGFFPARGSLEELSHLFDVARRAAEDAGRDPASLTFTAPSRELLGDDPLGAAQQLADLGVSRTVVPSFLLSEPSPEQAAKELSERVVEPLREVAPG